MFISDRDLRRIEHVRMTRKLRLFFVDAKVKN